jgi:hypothetical protein
MNVIKAIYQFLAGVPVILVGVLMTVSVCCALLTTVPVLAALPRSLGVILVFAVLIMLLSTVPPRKRTRVLTCWRPKEAPI